MYETYRDLHRPVEDILVYVRLHTTVENVQQLHYVSRTAISPRTRHTSGPIYG